MTKPLCTLPWFTLFISPFSYAPCCFADVREYEFPDSRQGLMEMFNSPVMVAFRERLTSGDIKGTRCEACFSCDWECGPPPQKINLYNNDPYFDPFIEQALCSYHEGKAVLDYLPLWITINTSHACNIKCVMCSQAMLNSELTLRKLPVDRVSRMLDDVGIDNLAQVTLAGGEVFYGQDGRAVVKHVNSMHPKRCSVTITTNGLLLHKNMQHLNNIERLTVTTSVDGTGETYNTIRKLSDWNTVAANIAMLKHKQQEDKPHWKIRVTSLIMRSSLPTLKSVLEELLSLVDNIGVLPVVGELYTENIRLYPSLAEDLSWRAHFEDAIAYAKAQGEDSLAKTLEEYYENQADLMENPTQAIMEREVNRLLRLHAGEVHDYSIAGKVEVDVIRYSDVLPHFNRFLMYVERTGTVLDAATNELLVRLVAEMRAAPDTSIPTKQNLHAKLGAISGKPFYIWGTGSNYRTDIRPWLMDNRYCLRFLGFIDNNQKLWGTELDGSTVHSPDVLKDTEAEAMVIASMYFNEIEADLAALTDKELQIVSFRGFAPLHRVQCKCLNESSNEAAL